MLQFLEDEGCGALAEDKSVAVFVEGARGGLGVVVAGGEGSHVAKASDACLDDGAFRPAGHHKVGLAEADKVEGIANGHRRCGAGRSGAVVGTLQAVADGNLAGTDVDDDFRYPVGAETGLSVFRSAELNQLVLKTFHTAHAGTPHNTETGLVDWRVEQTCITECLVDSNQAIDTVVVEEAELLPVEVVERIETFELASNLAFELGGIETCYWSGTAHTFDQGVPQLGDIVANRGERAETGNNYSFQLHRAERALNSLGVTSLRFR